ncbi:winged helix-turn-helix transcriptional regulator [Rhizobium panacihumi]|uniref:winged helix-turn-helix transcriptional regulator n=1 Tax=Rhizobium panacihumi TaxID=2008450 RepID=UPI003D7AB502
MKIHIEEFTSGTRDGLAIESALAKMGGKFKCIILSYLSEGEMRYNSLRNKIGSISDRTLANQLRELEIDGLVARIEYDCMPKRVEYSLTDAGQQLKPVMALMREWAVTNIKHD